jgi:AraC-like DNA-binding protein
MDLFRGTTFAHHGEGEDFSYLGGHVQLDPTSHELLADALPPWIHIRAELPQAAAFGWLLKQLVQEHASNLPGSKLASEQLAQLLFIQILRVHLATSESLPTGWLRALADPRIAPALRSIHREPSHSWGLEELARTAAMSRTMFAVRFKEVAGVAPLAYLAAWRMRLAMRALREEEVPVAMLARSLGYTSESAFSNAFKRMIGTSPKQYRSAARSTSISEEAPEEIG